MASIQAQPLEKENESSGEKNRLLPISCIIPVLGLCSFLFLKEFYYLQKKLLLMGFLFSSINLL
jgi:hypothetical protein